VIAEWLRDRRKHLRLTQTALAGRIGVSQAQVSSWETGKFEPTSGQLAALVEIFGPDGPARSSLGRPSTTEALATKCTFVQVEGGTDGVGKLVDLDRGQADIEFFESPAGPRLRRIRVSATSVREVELSPQTRVFWFDPEKHAWRAGRVDGVVLSAEALKATEDHYPVRFPNGHDVNIPISQLYVRWAQPIEDPTDYLAARITDTPLFFDGRSQIVRYLSQQRAGFGGLTGLASSAIELLEHQVATVRRILADPVERYLLADEVGLGKTIEAGILIRQHVLDRPREAAVLIVVPAHLVQQWRSELAEKFFLTATSPVHVISDDAFCDSVGEFRSITMLVVDEAHRPALRAFDKNPADRRLYEALRTIAEKVPRLLLLSGTPVLHQEEGFLAMLHLLDADGYPLSDLETFRRRVRERQTVAEATLDLADDASSYFAGESLQKLEHLFADDTRLLHLCESVRRHLVDDVASATRIRSLRALRTHLTEAYRLHRRLLRTRRDDPRVQLHLPRRMGAIRVEYDDEARREAFDFLDAWRLALPVPAHEQETRDHAQIFAQWVAAAFSHPRVLVRSIDARLASNEKDSTTAIPANVSADPWAFDGEETFLRARRRLILEAAGTDSRAQRLVTWLRANNEVKKAIVFVDDREVADLLTDTLRDALGADVVLRHDTSIDTVRSFDERQLLSVLVCDASAEEGLNLQRYGAAVVHFDLPLEPARIEQRIGRVDRLEARGRLRNVVFTAGCPYEEEWLQCLSDTIRVFDRSIAPLQYFLVEATGRIRSRLLREGRDAIEQETVRMGDRDLGLEAEMRRIRAQEAIDSVEGDADTDAAFFASLGEADEAAETTGERALNSWVTERLQFISRSLEPRIFRYVHDVRRPTLIPLLETFTRFEDCIDTSPKARDSRATLPLEPATFSRSTAETKHVGLIRVGHPFVTALDALVRSDDRGTAFAMWRYVPKSTRTPLLFFRFDFVIEADLGRVRADFGDRNSLESLRRRADEAFPVEYRTVWLNGDLEPVRHPRLLAVIERPYQQRPRPDGSKDVNVRMERWDQVDALVSTSDWNDRCRRARDAADRLIRSDPGFRERCAQAAKRTLVLALDVNESLKSRIARLSGSVRDAEQRMATFEVHVAEALAAGIESPSVRVDSAGAVVLASIPLEET